MFKTMFYQENRMKYSCKFFSYYLDISYEDLLKNLKLGKGELDKDKEKDKGQRSDYVAYIKDTVMNIEINCNEEIKILERNMEYAHRLYSKQVKRGGKYQYTQVIQFNLNNFAFEGNDKIVDIYYIQNDDGILLHNKLIFVQIYVPNLRKKWYTSGVDNLEESERYLLALIEPEIEVSLEFGKGDKLMEEYINEAVEVSDDFLGESYDKEWALRDQERREGKRENQKEMILYMNSQGCGLRTIQKLTGLSREEILRSAEKELEEEDFLGESYDKEWALKDQGHREGKRENQREMILYMNSQGCGLRTIQKLTGLSREEILRSAEKELEEEDFLGEPYDKEWALKDQGHREGKHEAQKEMILYMNSQGCGLRTIQKLTGLSREEILRSVEKELEEEDFLGESYDKK